MFFERVNSRRLATVVQSHPGKSHTTGKAGPMQQRVRKVLRPLAFLVPPATALLGLTIGMTLGAVIIVPAKPHGSSAAPPARAQQTATKPAPVRVDPDRRVVMQMGY
jgi:hypothetical protein